MDMKDNIIQAHIKVAYDQSHDHTSISHKDIKYLTQAHNKKFKQKQRSKTLSRSLWSIHISPPLATSYQKVHRKCIVLYVSQAWSSRGGVERTPRTKASVDVVGACGVAAGGSTRAVAAGADVVALVSGTCTASDLCPLGTHWNASVVVFPLFSSASSWSCSTAVWISVTLTSSA